jgi:hypothetical protein
VICPCIRHTARPCRELLVVACTIVLCPAAALAQDLYPGDVRVPTTAEVLAVNALVGGVTSATRALLTHNNPLRAFALGVVGGSVHFFGKQIGVGRHPVSGLAGLAVGATGTSIVSNAGRGARLFEELSFPIASLRLRLMPYATRHIHVAVNAGESAIIVHSLTRGGLAMDWKQSALNGTVVMNTKHRRIILDGEEFGGFQAGPVAVISSLEDDPAQILRHEITHVQQQRFMQEAWARPLESYLREHVPGVARLPNWFELGVTGLAIEALSTAMWPPNRGPVNRLVEAEAAMFQRR